MPARDHALGKEQVPEWDRAGNVRRARNVRDRVAAKVPERVPTTKPKGMFKNILVPTDGTPPARRAIECAVRFAREQKARVTGLWVGPIWRPNLYAYAGDLPPGFVSPDQFAADVKKTAARHLGVLKKAAAQSGVPCSCAYVRGNFPYQEIIRAARRNHCDLIVMGSHGRRGISKLLLGSQTNLVLAESTIPVLVCR
jgi:nucleotide-binding universal stress UspA family protein